MKAEDKEKAEKLLAEAREMLKEADAEIAKIRDDPAEVAKFEERTAELRKVSDELEAKLAADDS